MASHIQFATCLSKGILDYLIVTINRHNFTRMITSKLLSPQELANVMKGSLTNVSTVTDLNENTRVEQNAGFVDVQIASQELETEFIKEHVMEVFYYFPND